MLSRQLRSYSNPLTAMPPARNSPDYSTSLANLAARIFYRSPLPSPNDLPIYILDSWALPDATDVDYDALLPYALQQLPNDEELIGGLNYEVVFFAGGGGGNEATQTKKSQPGWGWFLSAYRMLTRATRKRLQKLYIVHEKKWIRVLVETFATIVSPKFRKKIVHGKAIDRRVYRGMGMLTIRSFQYRPSAHSPYRCQLQTSSFLPLRISVTVVNRHISLLHMQADEEPLV